MATPLVSPGVLVREVDLTVGRADNVLDNVGAIAGPFPIGPVDEAIDIATENDLIRVFGKPLNQDAQYEYWMSASSYLSYGGVLKVVRTGSATNFYNANAKGSSSGVSTAGTSTLYIKNFGDYELNHSSTTAEWIFAAKNPGSWANDLKVCVIDDKADQILSIGTSAAISVAGLGTIAISAGIAVTTTLNDVNVSGLGTVTKFTGTLNGVITGVNTTVGTIDVKIVSLSSTITGQTSITYKQGNRTASFSSGDAIGIGTTTYSVGAGTTTNNYGVLDWYDEQTIGLSGGTVYWRSIAPKPITNKFVLDNNGKNDAIHVVVIDDLGKVTGIQGSILEKFTDLSKASDSVSKVNSPEKNWWKAAIAQKSSYIFVGGDPSDGGDGQPVYQTAIGITTAQGLWNLPAQDRTFSAIGNVTYNLTAGTDYGGGIGTMTATLGDLQTSYALFQNSDEVQVDYFIMGPGLGNEYDSAAKASYLISLAELRKDCIAVISPHRGSVVDRPILQQTQNIINFYSKVATSSSYAIFDDNYKYTYDRFNNKFRYVPCNPDVAGLCVRTSIFAYPWFSPAGQQRGILNNAIKLAYNATKAQRDQLYPLRINSINNRPGVGILLYGDKTALGYASAFDHINVRRLFLTVEQALQRTAQAQLFELNDDITRANFINIVEPYLRDVQAKRGLYGFLVICDESNNTPDIIDNNEFRADIYLKPTKSINYVTLTFVATRTGVSFEEVAGRV
jgi:phage tail sheath protein FI